MRVRRAPWLRKPILPEWCPSCIAALISAPNAKFLRTAFESRSSFTGRRNSHCRSSSLKPGTRPNSLVLFVTSVRPLANAIEAISKSFGPIGVPRAAKWARIHPYSSAAESLNASEWKLWQKPRTWPNVCAFRTLRCAPYSSSATTTEQRTTLPGTEAASFAVTFDAGRAASGPRRSSCPAGASRQFLAPFVPALLVANERGVGDATCRSQDKVTPLFLRHRGRANPYGVDRHLNFPVRILLADRNRKAQNTVRPNP